MTKTLAIFVIAAFLGSYAGFVLANDEKGLPGQDYEATREEIIPYLENNDGIEEIENTDNSSSTGQSAVKSTDTPHNVPESKNTDAKTQNPQKKQKKTYKKNISRKKTEKKTISKEPAIEKHPEQEKPQLQPMWIHNSIRKSIVKFYNRYKGKSDSSAALDDTTVSEDENLPPQKQKMIVLRCKKGCPPPPGALQVEEENLPSGYLLLEKYDCWNNEKECEPDSLLLI